MSRNRTWGSWIGWRNKRGKASLVHRAEVYRYKAVLWCNGTTVDLSRAVSHQEFDYRYLPDAEVRCMQCAPLGWTLPKEDQ